MSKGSSTLSLELGPDDDRFDSESQLLSGLLTMRVVERVVALSQEPACGGLSEEVRTRLREMWMAKLFNHGGLSLNAAQAHGQAGDENSELYREAREIRLRSKYFAQQLPPFGKVRGCKGIPSPMISLPVSLRAVSAVQESYALPHGVTEGVDAVPAVDVAKHVQVERKNPDRRRRRKPNQSLQTQAQIECDAQWADELGYPFHGLLVEFRADTGSKTPWRIGRVNQLVFNVKKEKLASGELEAVSIRTADGEETELVWPSRLLRCVICPTLPHSSDHIGMNKSVANNHDELVVRGKNKRERADNDNDGDDNEEEDDDIAEETREKIAKRLGLEGLAIDLGPIGRKLRSRQTKSIIEGNGTQIGSLPPITASLMDAPLLSLPLPVDGQREALEARLRETEEFFAKINTVKGASRVRVVSTPPDGTTANSALAVSMGSKDSQSLGTAGVAAAALDPRDDPTEPLPEPSGIIFGSVDRLRSRDHMWTGVLRDAYVVLQGVSSILPQCRIQLDPTNVVDTTQPLPRHQFK